MRGFLCGDWTLGLGCGLELRGSDIPRGLSCIDHASYFFFFRITSEQVTYGLALARSRDVQAETMTVDRGTISEFDVAHFILVSFFFFTIATAINYLAVRV